MSGKGDRDRTANRKRFNDNFDLIFNKKKVRRDREKREKASLAPLNP